MIQSGVRSLFVLDNESRVIGLVTSYDIQGEKPIRYLQSLDCTHRNCCRDDVLVKDIMEPMDKLKNLDFKKVCDATVGNIVTTFRRVGRKHLVVVDHNRDQDESTIRGIFSATQLERQLGMTLVATPTTHSFADVEQALMHGW
jgi:CBS-domain-containing membrane protein